MSEMPSIRNRNIVVVGLQPWDTTIGSNCKDLSLEFSKHNRVLYVNYPLDRITLFRNRQSPGVKKRMNVISGKETGLVQINENMWNLYPDEMAESINWIPFPKIFDWFNRINNERFARSIIKAIKELGFDDIILFDDNDIMRTFYLKELLQPKTSIYYYRDYILGVNYWKRHGTRLEPLLIAKSDLCLTNSYHFAKECKKYNPNSFYVGQGCNLEMFADRKDLFIPDEMAVIPKPIIGYVGALQSLRLSIQILVYMAEKRPHWSIVLVGPEDEEFSVSRLHDIPNVFFTGARDPELLPAYIQSFDVCLNPQLINEITIGNYPRKIDEYLAMGKPVVATKTELMEQVFSTCTYLGSTKEEYVALTEQALAEDSPEKQAERKGCASMHSWENNVEEIYKSILKIEDGHGS